MDNHTRRVHYVAANRGITREQADAMVTASYADGTTTGLLTPGQRRRVAHSAPKTGESHYRRQRQARADRGQRRQALWAGA